MISFLNNFFNFILVSIFALVFRLMRRIIESNMRFFTCLGHPAIQPLLEKVGCIKAYEIYLKAKKNCPAYQQFLLEYSQTPPRSPNQLSYLPETNKENYIKKYSIEQRCWQGKIPDCGVVIDESSGSSGTPNNWVRGIEERRAIKRNIQISYALLFNQPRFFLINCFALGPWATGMNVSMSLVDVAILKSVGPDKSKIENTLKVFGNHYRYLIMGYPPFMKDFVETTTLNLKDYELHLIVGGEGISEGLRSYFLKFFKTVHSSYGASDLEINIGVETELTIALRKICFANPSLSQKIFGREDVPMIFQYNPADYVIERSPQGELIFTITRLANAAPKIRYNIKDLGGVVTIRHLITLLKSANVNLNDLAERYLAFPILFTYGRNDLSAPFYGAKIFPSDIQHILDNDEKLIANYASHRIKVREDDQLNKTLIVALEKSVNIKEQFENEFLKDIFYQRLKTINQDFREVSKLFTKDQLVIEQYDFGQGPFAVKDIRVKNKYFLD